jgi:hypothetical protein
MGEHVRYSQSRLAKTTALGTLVLAGFRLNAACAGSPPSPYETGPLDDGSTGGGAEGGASSSGGASSGGSGSSSGGGSGSSSGGGSGGSSSGGGSGSSSGGGSGGSSSGGGSGSSSGGATNDGGSSSGGIPTTGVCANNGTRILTSTQADAFIDDFEKPTLSSAWSSFNDVSPVVNAFQLALASGGALGTATSGHYAGSGAITTSMGGFGVGVLYNSAINVSAGVYCVDIAAFSGVSFWAKAATAGSAVSLNFVVPQANLATANDAGVPTGGDCHTSCYNYPHVTFALTTSWAQYAATFSAAAGGSTTVGSVIQEVEWLSPDSNWDFTLDEIAFYAGTPPAGAVGPNPH